MTKAKTHRKPVKKASRSERITIRIEPEIMMWVRRAAALRKPRCSKSAILHEAIVQGYNRRHAK